MLVGRIIFSMGGENLSVTQSAIACKWFLGHHLSFAMGLILSVQRFATVAGGYIYVPLYNYYDGNLFFPLIAAGFICVFSLLASIIMIIMDKKGDQ